jgi:signal peptidase II
MKRLQIFNKNYTALILAGIILDQLSKYLAKTYLSFYHALHIIKPILSFQLVYNRGAAYGILQNQRLFLLLVSFSVLVICYLLRNKIAATPYAKLALSFILIGACGNFLDRLFLGYVIDFINIRIFPLFNIADMSINLGIFFLILDMFTNRE